MFQLLSEGIFPRYPERMGEEMTRPSVCYSSTFTYISQQLLQKLAQLCDTSHLFILSFPFLLWPITVFILAHSPVPTVMLPTTLSLKVFRSVAICNLSISWCNCISLFMMYSKSVTSLIHSIPHTYITSE